MLCELAALCRCQVTERVLCKALHEGFRAIKLHEVDEKVIAAAPRDAALLLDVNCEWSVPEAIAVGRRLAPLNLEWFEEPVFPPEDAGCARWARAAAFRSPPARTAALYRSSPRCSMAFNMPNPP